MLWADRQCDHFIAIRDRPVSRPYLCMLPRDPLSSVAENAATPLCLAAGNTDRGRSLLAKSSDDLFGNDSTPIDDSKSANQPLTG